MLAASAASLVGAVLLLTVLGVLWAMATRRHLRRREPGRSEWDAGDRAQLWTSGARCPHCGRRGGVLEVDDDQLWFVCMACQRRHPREHRA